MRPRGSAHADGIPTDGCTAVSDTRRGSGLGPGRDGVDASPTALVCQSGGVSHH